MVSAASPEPEIHDPSGPPRETRPLRAPEPVVYHFPSRDRVGLRLTRYQAGEKGPVVLSHCIGVSQFMYSLDTIETNLVEYLVDHGFDVWLLDHRLSIELPASRQRSTLDEVATQDYPATVAKVRELTGASSVQIVAHGVGSSTLTMALLSGLEGVRSAVCSQVSTRVHVPRLSRFKARFTALMDWIGKGTVTAYTDARAGLFDRLYNASLRFQPMEAEERCRNPVCHRVTGIYGNLYEHDRLNPATHHALHELFSRVNLGALRQLSLLARVGHLVDASGRDAYLPHLSRMDLPVLLLHGGDNVCVLPRSTEESLQELAQANGADRYERRLIPGYGHVDCIFGYNAVDDVYPHVLQHLEDTDA